MGMQVGNNIGKFLFLVIAKVIAEIVPSAMIVLIMQSPLLKNRGSCTVFKKRIFKYIEKC